jgi:hypothetical protein
MVTGSPPVVTSVGRAALAAMCGTNTLSSSGFAALVRALRGSIPTPVQPHRRFGVGGVVTASRRSPGRAALSRSSLRAPAFGEGSSELEPRRQSAAPALRHRSGGGRLGGRRTGGVRERSRRAGTGWRGSSCGPAPWAALEAALARGQKPRTGTVERARPRLGPVRLDGRPPSSLGVVCVVAADGRRAAGRLRLPESTTVLRPCARALGIRPESGHAWIETVSLRAGWPAGITRRWRHRRAPWHVAVRAVRSPVSEKSRLPLRAFPGSTIRFAGWAGLRVWAARRPSGQLGGLAQSRYSVVRAHTVSWRRRRAAASDCCHARCSVGERFVWSATCGALVGCGFAVATGRREPRSCRALGFGGSRVERCRFRRFAASMPGLSWRWRHRRDAGRLLPRRTSR